MRSGNRAPRMRLVDVAHSAGVSKSIASRVLNGDPALLVRPETRERVLRAASELGYRPHAAARGLKRAETGALGLLVPPLTNPVYVRIIRERSSVRSSVTSSSSSSRTSTRPRQT